MKAEDVMREYTEEEIVKALEDWINRYKSNYYREHAVNALALLRKKDAEIERLTHICDSYALQYGTAVDKEALLKQERADTVLKMQERIERHATNGYPRKVRLDVIDQITKEMLES